MATYLSIQTILNTEVSCFANYDTPSYPRSIKLSLWLSNTKYRDKVKLIRETSEKSKRNILKASLPAITPSGLFKYRRAADLIKHSGLIQFDIDLNDNPHIQNYTKLKDQLSNLPFVAYCGLSASGTGYWGLVPIAYPERHSHHFDALKRVFIHYGIYLDDKPRNVASLRGYSYDSSAYFAKQPMCFDLYDSPKPTAIRNFQRTMDADTEQKRVEICISEICKRGIDITSGYNYWYAIGCDFASTFGESGRDYFQLISQFHNQYNIAQCDKQYNYCLRSYRQAQLNTFFSRCREWGISFNDLLA